jgi:PPK2 family polyphosphate:nucleotide phosphotransferase
VLAELRVEPRSAPALSTRTPGDRAGLAGKAEARQELAKLIEELSLLHNRLYAEASRSVLLILQGLDASGKDGTIKSVLTGVNPQGCRIVSFKEPTATELAHDYLRRVHMACPERGEIGIFNRSHYEDVVTARVRGLVPEEVWSRRPHHVREFERMLVDEGTTVVKVFLHVSREEQGKRLRARLEDPEKAWKFRRSDLDDRERWDEFMQAYEDAIRETSTEWAPWYVVPADHKWVRNVVVARLLFDALRRIDPQLPLPEPGLADLTIDS